MEVLKPKNYATFSIQHHKGTGATSIILLLLPVVSGSARLQSAGLWRLGPGSPVRLVCVGFVVDIGSLSVDGRRGGADTLE